MASHAQNTKSISFIVPPGVQKVKYVGYVCGTGPKFADQYSIKLSITDGDKVESVGGEKAYCIDDGSRRKIQVEIQVNSS